MLAIASMRKLLCKLNTLKLENYWSVTCCCCALVADYGSTVLIAIGVVAAITLPISVCVCENLLLESVFVFCYYYCWWFVFQVLLLCVRLLFLFLVCSVLLLLLLLFFLFNFLSFICIFNYIFIILRVSILLWVVWRYIGCWEDAFPIANLTIPPILIRSICNGDDVAASKVQFTRFLWHKIIQCLYEHLSRGESRRI